MAQLEVSILGQRYKVGCPNGEEDKLTQSAKDFNDQLAKMKSSHPALRSEQLIVIAALNFCHQINTEKSKNKEHLDNVNARIEELKDSLDAAFDGNNEEELSEIETNI